jgi:hypothetical protein
MFVAAGCMHDLWQRMFERSVCPTRCAGAAQGNSFDCLERCIVSHNGINGTACRRNGFKRLKSDLGLVKLLGFEPKDLLCKSLQPKQSSM